MSIAGDLETLEIFIFKCQNIGKKKERKFYFIPKQRNNLIEMIEIVDEAFLIMNKNLENGPNQVDIKSALEKEERAINKLRDKLRNSHLKSIENNDYSIQSGLIYSDLYSSLEKVGDHIINVSEGVNGQV